MNKTSLSTRVREILWSFRENKKQQVWVMSGVLSILIILLVGLVVYANRPPKTDTETEVINVNMSDVSATERSNKRFIDGVEVELGAENRIPIAVMIENLVTVRPQTGLQSANVVYEALAEGGITRFMAIYAHDTAVATIGPVRSARSYFVDWAEEYKGMYAHAGGSPQALQQLSENGYIIEDLNQIGGDQSYFWRDASTAAPHNLFTSSELLAYALRDKALDELVGTYAPWKFESPIDKPERTEEEKYIDILFYSSSYNVRYEYDREANTYKRFNGGEEHTDALTNEQITVSNIVIQFVETSILEEDSGRLAMKTVGEGDALVFHEGETIAGVWRKENADERTRFFDLEGVEISFIPGNIWIEVIPEDRTVEYN